MPPIVHLLLFLTTAPIALLPTILAFATRHPSRVAIVVGNLVLWVLGYLLGLGAVLALIAWLFLLAYVIRSPRPATVAAVAAVAEVPPAAE